MATKLKPIGTENLGQRAYIALRSALTEGRYRAGERLRLRDLADELGTSVTPVREAVLQLVNDGALQLRSPRDIRVRALTGEEYVEIVSVRKALEGLAIEQFVDRAEPRHLTELRHIEDRHQAALDRRDYRAAVALDRRFIFTILEIAKMPILQETVDRIWLLARPAVSLLYSDEGVTRANLNNLELLEALTEGNAAEAIRSRHRTLDQCGDVIVEMLARQDGDQIAANA